MHGGASPLLLQAVFADVGIGADRDVKLGPVRAGDDVLRPVVVAACRQVDDLVRGRRNLGRALLIGKGHDRIGIGNVELAVEQCHAERRIEPGDEGRFRFRHAVTVRVAQQRYAIGALTSGAGPALDELSSKGPHRKAGVGLGWRIAFCDQHIAIRQHVKPAGMIEAARKFLSGKAWRGRWHHACRPGRGFRDTDGWHELHLWFDQKRIGTVGLFNRHRCLPSRQIAEAQAARGRERAEDQKGNQELFHGGFL
ncbi:hypothetical protein D9M68_378580 [compost metagenome]